MHKSNYRLIPFMRATIALALFECYAKVARHHRHAAPAVCFGSEKLDGAFVETAAPSAQIL